MKRDIDPAIIAYFKTRKPFSYGHLIKFERPIISSQELNTSEKEFVYLTDASRDLHFNDPRVDTSPANLAVKYRANRVMDVPAVTEYSEARATSLNLELDGNAIGAYLADTVNISGGSGTWEITFQTISVYNKGLVEGDKISLYIGNDKYELEIIKFPKDNVLRVSGNLVSGAHDVYIELTSQELVSILQDKTSDNYASFINRTVEIYKVFFDEENNRIGTPYYLYKGIIQDVSLDESDGAVKVNWTLNSHWGDFAEVKGRITSDESHRALNERGEAQPDAAVKPIYAYDKGFIHADTAVHVESTYTVQVEKQDVKYKKGFFGIGAKVKVKKYFEDEGRQTELDFQLQGKTLNVIYGVQPAEGNPIFADTKLNDSTEIYAAYSLCEGEIAAIYDVIIQDKSLICANEADFDARSTQNEENSIDIVCYGRADRGDVLEGITSTSNNLIPFYNTDLITYFNEQNNSLLTNYEGYVQPLGTYTGTVGILHENSIKLSIPMDITIGFYAGKEDQRAAPDLASIGQAEGFKIQNDYWVGNKMEYWGPNHRMLDTAYATVKYKIAENETTIPSIRFVVKGKFVDCYNYDETFQHSLDHPSENPAIFNVGDSVQVFSSADILIASTRITDKFFIRNKEGQLEARFLLEDPLDLDYNNGVPGITELYMLKGTDRWTMRTYNYSKLSGTVSRTIVSPVTGVIDDGGQVVIDVGDNNLDDLEPDVPGGGGRRWVQPVRLVEY